MEGRRYWLLALIALALGSFLRAPALDATLASDDWDHYAMVAGVYPAERAPWDLYRFVADDDGERQALRDSGRLPWWSDADLQLAFFRPLASLTVWTDHALWSGDERAGNLHSLLWWWIGALGVAALFRALFPAAVALVGVFLYAADDAHALPLAWRANRAELIAVALMVWALWARIEHRRRGLPRHQWLSLVLIYAAMLSGEHAIAMLAFLVACALAEPEPLRARLRASAALIAPALVYLIARGALGYGVFGSGFYADPLREPLRFADALAVHAPLLSGDLVLGYAADYWYGEPPWRDPIARMGLVPSAWLEPSALHTFQRACGVLSLIGIAAASWALGRRAAPESARPLCWLLAGALLALVPLSAALPMTRLTAGPALALHAAFAWLAVAAFHALRGPARPLWRVGALFACALPIALHGGRAAARSRELAVHYASDSRAQLGWVAGAELGGASLAERHVLLLGSSDLATSFSLPFARRFAGVSTPETSELLLPPGSGPVVIERVSDRILDVSARTKEGFRELRASAYRREDRDFAVGDYAIGPRFSALVLAARDGVPTRMRFVFARPLEHPGYLFVYPMKDGLSSIAPPPIGGSMRLPAPAAPRAR